MKKFRILSLWLMALVMLSCCNSKKEETNDMETEIRTLKLAIERYDTHTKKLINNEIPKAGYDCQQADLRMLKMALRRDSCYSDTIFVSLLPEIAKTITTADKFALQQLSDMAENAEGDYSKFEISIHYLGQCIVFANRWIPFCYSLKELEWLQPLIDGSLAMLENQALLEYFKDLPIVDYWRDYIYIGHWAQQRYKDRRFEILNGNIYNSILFLEIGDAPNEF